MSSMTRIPESEFENYQSQHLFLLIGSNPLPNYVAAKLLLKPGGHLYLVCTAETYTIAERLKNELGRNNANATFIQVDDSDGYDIATKIKEQAKGKNDVGLNYTGGTKAMAVHAHETLCMLNASQVICSYLASRELRLVFVDAEWGARFYPANRSETALTLKKLLALHGLSLEKPINTKLSWLEFVKSIQSNYSAWREWTSRFRNGENLSRKDYLEALPLPVNPQLAPLAVYWAGCANLGDLLKKWKEDKPDWKIDDLAKWLEGEWLEIYTLHCIDNIRQKYLAINDAGSDVNPKERDFQFDVALMSGYQLYAISCTISTKKALCKSKLFELVIRARQIGGDEARFALVCGASEQDAKNLQYEIETDWDVKNRVRVFGINAWADLETYLKDWLHMEDEPHA